MLDSPTEIIHLPNGARIVSIQTPDTGLTCIMMHVRGGCDNEVQQGDVEMTHLLEHMVAKLTSEKYPCSKQVSLLLDTLAVNRVAMTTSSENVYLLEGQDKYAPLMLDILLRAFLTFRLDSSIFENEKAAVQQELKAFLDTPDYSVKHTIDTLLFPGTKRSLDIAKVVEIIQHATPDMLLAFRSRYHIPENFVLLIAAAHPASLVQKARQVLARMPATRKSILPLDQNVSPFALHSLPQIVQVDIDSSETFVYMAIPLSMTMWDKRKYALEALRSILSRGHSSRLMKSLRSELGLIYQAFCDVELHPYDPRKSLLVIETSTKRGQAGRVIQGILQELDKLATHGIRQDELERFKNQLNTDYSIKQADQSPSRYIRDYVNRLQWTDSLLFNQAQWEKARSLTKKEIDNLARSLFQKDKILTVVGLGTT